MSGDDRANSLDGRRIVEQYATAAVDLPGDKTRRQAAANKLDLDNRLAVQKEYLRARSVASVAEMKTEGRYIALLRSLERGDTADTVDELTRVSTLIGIDTA